LAVDHNVLLMDVMRRVGRHHNFRVILHEKPFKGINGSGKHNNWSMMTNTGVNLLSPGKNPKTNLQFLVFLVNTIKAVYKHSDLLKASIASAGNAHRLGANEAPPAIISVFIGTQLTQMLDQLENFVSTKKMSPDEKIELKLNIIKVPKILLDNTDRNRTSPFAFTGNKFEFRAVGSSANCASAMTTLNLAVAEQLMEFKKDVEALVKKNIKRDEAIFQVLRKYISESKPIRFEGNNYSEEWKAEARKRGLSDLADVPDIYDAYLTPKSKDLFIKLGIMSEREIYARNLVRWDTYIKRVQVESRILGDLALNHIIPVSIKYQTELIENVKGLKEIFGANEYKALAAGRLQLIEEISNHITNIKTKVAHMIEERKKANVIEDEKEKASAYSKNVFPLLEAIRSHIDELELVIDDELWPLPKYRELLFIR